MKLLVVQLCSMGYSLVFFIRLWNTEETLYISSTPALSFCTMEAKMTHCSSVKPLSASAARFSSVSTFFWNSRSWVVTISRAVASGKKE